MSSRVFPAILTLGALAAAVQLAAGPHAEPSAALAGAQARTQAQQYLDAVQLMETKGDYPAAAKLFEAVSAGKDRNLAARALLVLAEVYEKQGKADAERTLRDLVNHFPDQSLIVAEARTRLAALTAKASDRAPARSVRRLWSPGDNFNPIGAPSRDGRLMPGMNATSRQLMIADLKSQQVRRLEGHESNGQGAAVSPDGRLIAFVTFAAGKADGPGADEVRVVGIDGTGGRTIRRHQGGDTWVCDWDKAGTRVLILETHNGAPAVVAFVDVANGLTTELVTFRHGRPLWVSVSPDGRSILYDLPQKEGAPERDIYLFDLETGKATALVAHPANDMYPFWTPDGERILFASSRARTPGLGLWMLRVSNGQAVGDPQPIDMQMGRWWPVGMAKNGTLYYDVTTGLVDVFVAPLDLAANTAGKPVVMAQRVMGSNLFPGWSADSGRLAFTARRGESPGELRSTVLVIHDVQSGAEHEVTPETNGSGYPRWSPDGRSLMVGGGIGDTSGLCLVDQKSGAAQLIMGDPVDAGPPEWSVDGRRLIFRTRTGLDELDMATLKRREIYHSTSSIHPFVALSHDGRRVAFWEWTSIAKTSPLALRVIPAGGGDAVTIWTAPDPGLRFELAGWSPDDRELLFVQRSPSTQPALYRVSVAAGMPRPLGLSASGMRDAKISPDGRYVAYTAGWPKYETFTLENFLPPRLTLKPGVSKSPTSSR